jgi:hypothetical protein
MRWTALLRQILRLCSIGWILLALFLAYGRLEVWPATRDIGAGVMADCPRGALSEIPQIILSVLGFALLARVANGPMPAPRRECGLLGLLVVLSWVVAAFAVPLLFAENCVN